MNMARICRSYLGGPQNLDVCKTRDAQEVDWVVLIRSLHLGGHDEPSECEVSEMEGGEGVVIQHGGQSVVCFVVVGEPREVDVEECKGS